MSIEPLGTNFSEILIQNSNIFIHKNASENIVSETVAILSRGDELNIHRVSWAGLWLYTVNRIPSLMGSQYQRLSHHAQG